MISRDDGMPRERSVKLEVLPDAAAASTRAAALVAEAAREAAAARGRAALALSGGETARPLLRALAAEDVPWDRVHVFQVDERVVPAGDPRRNLAALRAALGACAERLGERLHPMPVEAADLVAAAASYAAELERAAGSPPVLDLVHLGLGADGHTASLAPGDPVLELRAADVAIASQPLAGTRRMTLTLPALARAQRVLWLVVGAAKAEILARLLDGDLAIPAGRVPQARALAVVDRAAAGPRAPARGA
jgi:6-phosphogluconolactonase